MRGKRYILRTLCAACVFAALVVDQHHSIAAQATPIPKAIQLTIGQTVSGSLSQEGQTRDYIFTLPDNQDVIVWSRSSRLVSVSDCQMQIARGSKPPANIPEQNGSCQGRGGGSDEDSAINHYLLFAAQPDPNLQTVIALHFTRLFDGLATQKLTALAVSGKPLEQGVPLSDTLTVGMPFQEYTIQNDAVNSFVVEAEENKPNGAYLWVTHTYTGPGSVPDPLAFAEDQAYQNAATGLLNTFLFYTGASQYRFVVYAIGSYTINYAGLTAHTLDNSPSVTFKDSVSYLKPTSIAVLNASAGETLTISGYGPDTDLYTLFFHAYQGPNYLAVDRLTQPNANQPLSSTAMTVPQPGPVYIFVQLPYPAPRTPLDFTFTVTRGQATATP